VYEGWGKPAAAEPFLRELLSAYREGAEASSPAGARARVQLGMNLLRQKKEVEEAARLLREGLEVRAGVDPDGWQTADTRSWLGEALLAQGKAAEAKPLLERGYDGLKRQQARVPARLRQVRLWEAVERLVRVSEALDEAEAAARWREEQQRLSQPAANK
jgi:hypothetical protein